MSPELFLTVVIIAGVVSAITALLRMAIFQDQDPPTPIEPQPRPAHPEPAALHEGCEQHLWRIASRENTAGQDRVIYRCERCQKLEIREVAIP